MSLVQIILEGRKEDFAKKFSNKFTEEQKQIVASFPKRDRGIKDSDDDEAPELDPLDAAALKAKLKQ